jgi:branched-chain amino acid transport system substrate-binding protein
MSTRRLLAGAVVAVACLVAGCGDDSSDSEGGGAAGGGEPIVIGSQIDLTGAAGYVGIGGRYGMELAIEQINANGGINGRQLELVTQDSATTPEGGALATRKLVQQDKADIILSVAASTSTLAAVPVAIGLKIPFVANTSGDPTLLDAKSPYIYRGAVSGNETNTTAMTDVVKGFSPSRVALLVDRTNPGNIKAGDLLEEKLPAAGIEVATRQGFEITDTNFTSQIAAVKESDPDLVVLVTNPQASGRILRQLDNAGVTVQTVGDVGQAVPELIDLAGEKAVEEHVVMWSAPQWIEDETGDMGEFRAAFDKKFPDANEAYPNFVSLWAYADMFVIADALTRAGDDLSADAIVKALDETSYTVGDAPFDYAYAVGLPREYGPDDHEGTETLGSLIIRSGEYGAFEEGSR